MALTKEEEEATDVLVAKFRKELWAGRTRTLALIFGLAGWVVFEHWHIVPAVVLWTLATLFFFASYSPPKS